MSKLYIVATPIGNLEDISMRALRILSEVDFVLCEDTRVTGKLMQHFEIKTPRISYHQHSDDRKNEEVLKLLEAGKDLALVSDAGTPGISDPGGKLVALALERLGERVSIESVPGPSAVTAALSITGIPTEKFVFLGFPPHKKGRQTFIRHIGDSIFPVVIYESKHRIIKFLEELVDLNKEIEKHNEEAEAYNFRVLSKEKKEKKSPITSVVVCRELSKMHETVYRGELKDIIEKIKNNADDQRGEFVVVVGKDN
jgi:16S rRNA (cytidine1402-2'-O)-methyltransferase